MGARYGQVYSIVIFVRSYTLNSVNNNYFSVQMNCIDNSNRFSQSHRIQCRQSSAKLQKYV